MEKITKKLFILCSTIFVILAMFKTNVSAESYVNGGASISRDYGVRDVNTIYLNGTEQTVSKGVAYTVSTLDRLHYNQPKLKVDLKDYGLNSVMLNHGACPTVIVVFQIRMKELDDGYQEIYFYSNSDSNNTAFCSLQKFDIPGNGKDTEFKRYEFYGEITGTSFGTDSFMIGFSANGWKENDWQFRNPRVQILVSTEKRKITNLLHVTNPYALDPASTNATI